MELEEQGDIPWSEEHLDSNQRPTNRSQEAIGLPLRHGLRSRIAEIVLKAATADGNAAGQCLAIILDLGSVCCDNRPCLDTLRTRKEVAMPFVAFHELFPEVGTRETRVLTIFPGADTPLPPGEYSFIEMFCDEQDCDCRRAFFTVFSHSASRMEALIAWGWENAAFYQRWLGMDDPDLPDMIEQMQGPILDLNSPISRNAELLLDFFAEVLLADPLYVERVKKHYRLFREAIDAGKKPQRVTRQRPEMKQKIGRNDRCPCGSGKKFKNCCLNVPKRGHSRARLISDK
jgi:hypothetical protein